MTNSRIIFVLSCLITMSIILCGTGCTPDEKNEYVNNENAQIPDPAQEQPKIQTEKTAPPAEIPDTVPEGKINKTAESDVESEGKMPPAELVLISDLWEKHTKGAPILTHEKHIEVHKIECNECHHVYEGGENLWKEGMPVDKCEKCHNEPTIKGEKKLPPDVQKKNLKLAFHGNCKGCHKKVKKENPETTAPVTCKQCHPKK